MTTMAYSFFTKKPGFRLWVPINTVTIEADCGIYDIGETLEGHYIGPSKVITEQDRKLPDSCRLITQFRLSDYPGIVPTYGRLFDFIPDTARPCDSLNGVDQHLNELAGNVFDQVIVHDELLLPYLREALTCESGTVIEERQNMDGHTTRETLARLDILVKRKLTRH